MSTKKVLVLAAIPGRPQAKVGSVIEITAKEAKELKAIRRIEDDAETVRIALNGSASDNLAEKDAAKTREQAEKLLADAEKVLGEAKEEAQRILSDAQKRADEIVEAAQKAKANDKQAGDQTAQGLLPGTD